MGSTTLFIPSLPGKETGREERGRMRGRMGVKWKSENIGGEWKRGQEKGKRKEGMK